MAENLSKRPSAFGSGSGAMAASAAMRGTTAATRFGAWSAGSLAMAGECRAGVRTFSVENDVAGATYSATQRVSVRIIASLCAVSQ
eukprot:1518395-Prymnesium_polylepis.1